MRASKWAARPLRFCAASWNFSSKEARLIIFINGAFGVGKTTTANHLHNVIPNSLIFDPELVGWVLRRVLRPFYNPYDYQDYRLWRVLTRLIIRLLHHLPGQRTIIVPMSIWRPDYFGQIVTKVRQSEQDVYHLCLVAPPDTIYQRLLERGDEQGGFAWKLVEPCCTAFASLLFSHQLDTEGRSPDEIVTEIYRMIRTP